VLRSITWVKLLI